MKKGYIHVYTGDGKGKTTAAIGAAVRALGAGLKVYMIQFMKRKKQNELKIIKKIPGFNIAQYGRKGFVSQQKPDKKDIEIAEEGFEHAEKIIQNAEYDVVILDEINVAINYNLLETENILKIIKNKPKKLEIILTGRYAPKKLIKISDIVTEMKEIKHLYKKGIEKREGIDL